MKATVKVRPPREEVEITFGTSGWRGIIGRDFTFHNVRLVIQAIASMIEKKGEERSGVIIGYDTRFLSEHFAREAANVFSRNRIRAFLCERDTPAPALSAEILRRQAHGGVNFTASHNPPEYQGLLFSGEDGSPALPHITRAVEKELRVLEKFLQFDGYYPEPDYIEVIDPHPAYLEDITRLVDLDLLRRSGLRFAVDPMYGTSRDYLDRVLADAGCRVEAIHNYRDPYFGRHGSGTTPENLQELGALVREKGCDLGLATDVDADRFGIVDRDGTFVRANQVLALLLDYLAETRKWRGGKVARTVATSHLLDRVAARHGLEVIETPVGFKYIGSLITRGEIVFGGEESSGLSIRGHIPEKDGILACLLTAEMMAFRGGQSLAEMLRTLYAQVGPLYDGQAQYRVSLGLKQRLLGTFSHPPRRFNGHRVKRVIRKDGIKLILEDGSWFLMRLSGTEPLVRCYAEAASRGELRKLMETGKRAILQP